MASNIPLPGPSDGRLSSWARVLMLAVAGGCAGGCAPGLEDGSVAGTGGAAPAGTGGATMPGSGGSGSGSGGAMPPGTGGRGSGGAPGIGGRAAGGATGTGGTTPAGTGGAGGASTGCGVPGVMGAFAGSVTVGAETRTYYMFVPPTYDPQVPQRLVLGYHGSNYTGMLMRRYLDLERAPLLDRTIFVYPDGMNAAMAWNTAADSRDMAYFDALVAKLQSEYCIDRDRIFATGQSYGALITNALGCYKGNVLRAIAVAAGSGPRSSAMCQDRVAVWITHGMDDGNVDYASGVASRDFWASANGCGPTMVTGDPVQCFNYEGCLPGYPVIWCPHVGDAGDQIPSFGRDAMRKFLASF